MKTMQLLCVGLVAAVFLSACGNTKTTRTTHTARGITETRTVTVEYPQDVRNNRERQRGNTLPDAHTLN